MGVNREKIEFYSGHTGTDIWEIAILFAIYPVSYLNIILLLNYINMRWKINLINIVLLSPLILSLTVFSNYLFPIIWILIVMSLFIWIIKIRRSYQVTSVYCSPAWAGFSQFDPAHKPLAQLTQGSHHCGTDCKDSEISSNTPRHGTYGVEGGDGGQRLIFLSVYRAYVLLATFVCILAVDFPAFPRKFAKTESYGLSFMDIGVGTFVFTNAVVSPQAKNVGSRSGGNRNTGKSYRSNLRQALILLTIGTLRTALVKTVNYHEHVTEYGSHWNFFITLSVLKMIGSLLDRVRFVTLIYESKSRNGITPTRPLLGVLDSFCNFLIFASIHHTFLNVVGLEKFYSLDADDSRSFGTLFLANREGILSLPGYVALYALGTSVGKIIFLLRSSQMRILVLFIVSAAFGIIYLTYPTVIGDNVSRRMCNVPYIIVVGWINVSLLVMYSIVVALTNDIGSTKLTTESINYVQSGSLLTESLEILNKNGLVLFLIANLLTGLINICIDTQHTSSSTSLTIIYLYMFAILNISSVLRR